MALYAASLSKDWTLFLCDTTLVTQVLTKAPLFEAMRNMPLPDMSDFLGSNPLRRSGASANTYHILKELLSSTVDWLLENEPHFMRELCSYVRIFDRISFLPPDVTEKVNATNANERDWLVYRWSDISLVLVVLAGESSRQSVSTANLPSDLTADKATVPLIMRIMTPGGTFPRYQVWHPESHRHASEDQWFALNFLGRKLARSVVDRRGMRRHMALISHQLDPVSVEKWRSSFINEINNLPLALNDVRTSELIDAEDVGGLLRHLFPYAKRPND